MKLRYLVLFGFLFSYGPPTQAATNVAGNDADPTLTFAQVIQSAVYDKCSGDIYFGLAAGGGANAVSRLGRNATATTPIGQSAFLSGNAIRCLTIPNVPGLSPLPFVAAVDGAVLNRVVAFKPDGTLATQSAIINDAGGAAAARIAESSIDSGFCMAASRNIIFAPVVGNGDANYGISGNDSGIALISVDPTTLALDVLNANTGASGGNTAFSLNYDNAVFIDTLNPGLVPNATQVNSFWDEELQRFYFAPSRATSVGGSADTSGHKFVAVGRLSGANALSFSPIVPTFGAGAGATAHTDLILSTINNTGGNINIEPVIIAVRIMHTSTGLPYIILMGGNFLNPGEKWLEDGVWAMPLINDPGAAATLFGTASDNTLNAAGNFDTAATAASTNATDETVYRRARVGGGPLPNPPTGSVFTRDLTIIGDTIFSSHDDAFTAGASQTAANVQPGVYYSTAQFDDLGRIVAWTPWQKIAPFGMFTGATGVAEQGRTQFAFPDLVTGKITVSEGEDQRAVRRTNWETGSVATDLPTNLNAALSAGCFCALDLHKWTRGFTVANGGGATDVRGRYTLFGGDSKVVFIRTSQRTADGEITDNVQTDFTAATATNFLDTTLPGSPGAVTCLEYSRRLNADGTQGFFFAGTPNGMFGFAATAAAGAGFTPASGVDALNAAPFSTSSWRKLTPFGDDVIIDIKSHGEMLYCITCADRASGQLPEIRMFRVPFAADLDTMFTTATVVEIANNAEAPFTEVSAFNGMQIMSTGPNVTGAGHDPRIKEQLVLATSNGVFHSNATQGAGLGAPFGSISAADTAAMTWTRFPCTEGINFVGVTGSNPGMGEPPILVGETANDLGQHTVWPISLADDGLGTFERGRVYQVSLTGNAAGSGFTFTAAPSDPADFNAESPGSFSAFNMISRFWTDGARRFFTTSTPGNKKVIETGSFFNDESCTTSLNSFADDAAFAGTRNIHCFTTTGLVGEFVVGTDNGVVVLR